MRVVVDAGLRLWNTDAAQNFDGLGPRSLGIKLLPLGCMRPQTLDDLPANRVDRVERGARFLKHHCGIATTSRAQLVWTQPQDILTGQQNGPLGNGGAGQQTEN